MWLMGSIEEVQGLSLGGIIHDVMEQNDKKELSKTGADDSRCLEGNRHKKWLSPRLPYKVSFLSSAKAAPAPALLVALAMYEGAKVTVQVASQTRSLPFFQGKTEIPSSVSHLLCKRLMVS